MSTKHVVFNTEALSELTDLESAGENDLVPSLMRDYLEMSQNLIIQLDQASAQKDYKAFEGAVHSLKSSSSLLGLESLAALAFQLENDARDKQIQWNQLDDLKSELGAAHIELKKFLQIKKS